MDNRFQEAASQQFYNNTDTPQYHFTIPGLEYDILFPDINPETVDYAVKSWFEIHQPIYIEHREDERKKVKVIFSTIERWAMMQHREDLRDESGILKLPIISIRRGEIQTIEERTPTVDKDGSTNILLYVREYINPVSERKEYIADYSDTHDRKNIVEAIEIQAPKMVRISYSVIFWANYIQDLNVMIQHMIQNFTKRHSVYASEKVWFPAFLEGLSDNSNDEEIANSQRIFKTNFSINVEAPFIDPKTIKTYRTYQGINTEIFSDEQVLSTYQSAKVRDAIDWDSPYKLRR